MAAGASAKDKKEADSNKDAPPWLVDEDWLLLQAVRLCLGIHGNINWALVADFVQLSQSYLGRVRSRQQCKDRYFNHVMLVEEGKLAVPETKKAKKGKAGEDGGASAPSKAARGKLLTIQRRCEVDRRQSVLALHTSFFKVATAPRPQESGKGGVGGVGPSKARKSDTVQGALAISNVSMDKYLASLGIAATASPTLADVEKLSEHRIVMERRSVMERSREQAVKSAAQAAAEASNQTTGASAGGRDKPSPMNCGLALAPPPIVSPSAVAAASAPSPVMQARGGSNGNASVGVDTTARGMDGTAVASPIGGAGGMVRATNVGVRPQTTASYFSSTNGGSVGTQGAYQARTTAHPSSQGTTRPHSRYHQMALFLLTYNENQQQNALVRAIYNDSNKSEGVKVCLSSRERAGRLSSWFGEVCARS